MASSTSLVTTRISRRVSRCLLPTAGEVIHRGSSPSISSLISFYQVQSEYSSLPIDEWLSSGDMESDVVRVNDSDGTLLLHVRRFAYPWQHHYHWYTEATIRQGKLGLQREKQVLPLSWIALCTPSYPLIRIFRELFPELVELYENERTKVTLLTWISFIKIS